MLRSTGRDFEVGQCDSRYSKRRQIRGAEIHRFVMAGSLCFRFKIAVESPWSSFNFIVLAFFRPGKA